MGLTDFVKKQFIDVIEWIEDDDETLVWRFPTEDREIQYGAMLTVRESQAAVFVNEGQVADVFGPGLHKLTTQTIPLLTNLKNWDKLFASPFKSEVYFVSMRQRLGRKWGTPQPVTIRDQDFGAVQVRAFGQYAWHVQDARTLVASVSGTIGSYPLTTLEDQLRGTLVSSLATVLGSSGHPFLDLAGNQEALATLVAAKAAGEFQRLGLALDTYHLVSLTLPEALQEALDRRIRMGMLGDLNRYTQMQAADALTLAAANPGAGGVAALGAQVAVGVGMAQAMTQGMAPVAGAAPAAAAAPVAAAAAAGTAAASPAQAKLQQLKSLFEQGLIEKAEYDQARQRVLNDLTGS
jgi:membrane protease subunit (stomatin/prohibitin family)